jgi:hypothetical protein
MSEPQLRRLSRELRATASAVASGNADPDALRDLSETVRAARWTCAETEGGTYGLYRRPSHRRLRRTLEDARQMIRRAEIVLSALAADA